MTHLGPIRPRKAVVLIFSKAEHSRDSINVRGPSPGLKHIETVIE
jgi:hypothetical protein